MKRALLIRTLILASLTLLGTGAFSPLLTTERFYFFSNTFSLISGIRQLVANEQLLIAVLITLFSLCIPVAKAGVIWAAASGDATSRPLLLIADSLGKWSMLEVFIAALLIIALKLGPVVDATLHYGVWLLAASVLLSGIASQLVAREPKEWTIFSSPETLTVGAVGGALVAASLIGLLNMDLLRLDALVGTPESRCIQRVLRLDRRLAEASATESEYASSLIAIDSAACPAAFHEAFADYAGAWKTLASIDPEEASEPSLLDRAGALVGLVATRESALEDVEAAWAAVDRVAADYGVEAPGK